MNSKASLFSFGLVLATALGQSAVASAAAPWPSGQVRTIPGVTCVASQDPDGTAWTCPFVSDTESFFGGANASIFFDYSAPNANVVTVDACRQSWTGSGAFCGNYRNVTAAGNQDVEISGFSTLGTASIWDYFYTQLFTQGNNLTIYGVGYSG